MRSVHHDYTSLFENLLSRDHNFSSHYENMQYLLAKTFKDVLGLTESDILKYGQKYLKL